MAESAKYPAWQLTEDDKIVLDKVFINYAILIYNWIQEYPNPKDYAKKFVSKANDKYFATLCTLMHIKDSPSNQILKPGELNEKLANDIKNYIKQDISAKAQDNKINNDAGFLHPRDLREVLKKFEKHNILRHLDEKKEIRYRLRETHRPGKKSSSGLVHCSNGGRPSVYIVKEDVEKLKRAMEKPEALDYLYIKVVRSGLAHKVMKYVTSSWIYAVKIDENMAWKFVVVAASYFQEKVDEQIESDFKKMLQMFQSADDNQLEYYIDEVINDLIHDLEYHHTILFIIGLAKLLYC